MITVLIAATLLIPNSAFADVGKIVPDDNISPNPSGLKNTGVNESPPNYPPGLEQAGFTRVISPVTSDTDISEINQKGCTVINRLNQGTSFFCPSELVDTLNNVRPVKMYQIQDLFQSQQIQADLVWDQGYDGSRTGVSFPVTVAILDTGVQSDHDELENDIFTTRDFTGEGGDYLDYNGHGTHVTGIVTADGVYNIQDTNNKATGVAPGAEVIVGKICKSGGCPEDAIIAGIEWATSQGAEVINMSIGGGLSYDENCDNDGDNTVDAVNQAVSQGVVVVIASGNDGNKDAVSYPGCASGAIAVGAVDINDNVASFSNAGPALDIVAPGVDTLSSWSCNASIFLSCDDTWYYQASGTSMATPHVAGVVALMLDKSPDLTVSEVKEAIYSTAVDVGEYDANGRVDAYAAVNYESAPFVDEEAPVISANPISDPYEITLTDQYVESCTATDDDPSYEGNCRVSEGGIDTSILGYHAVTYTADPDDSGKVPEEVIVSTNIQDTIAPAITLNGDASVTLVVNVDTYSEEGATVTDNNKATDSVAGVGGDSVNNSIVGTYIVEYYASDPSGNSAINVTRTVDVVKGDVPVITILGNNPETVELGDAYIDEGATASDTEDGDLTDLIIESNNVNSNSVGEYTVDYEVTDKSGNTVVASRIVNVVDSSVTVHVSDLDAKTSGNKNWHATVTINVDNQEDNSMAGVTVQGEWSGDETGSDSCVTDSLGQCEVTQSTKGTTLTFTVTSLSGTDIVYDSTANNDPDGDSDGTSIIITNEGSSGGGDDGGGGPNCDKKPDHPKCG